MVRFDSLFKDKKVVIGMVHLLALPGTPSYLNSTEKIITQALFEAKLLADCGVDAILIENMNDTPYIKNHVGPEITSLMAVISSKIKEQSKLPVGIQILAAANKEALAVAHAANLDFIRAEGFVFGHVADEGYIDSCAGELLRYRKMIGAEKVAIFTDIKKKHSSHQITADVDLLETVHAAEFFLSDGVIITGSATGKPASLNELKSLKSHCKLPILIGSGIDEKNIGDYISYADAFIVGSSFKHDGDWQNMIDEDRVRNFMKKFRSLHS